MRKQQREREGARTLASAALTELGLLELPVLDIEKVLLREAAIAAQLARPLPPCQQIRFDWIRLD